MPGMLADRLSGFFSVFFGMISVPFLRLKLFISVDQTPRLTLAFKDAPEMRVRHPQGLGIRHYSPDGFGSFAIFFLHSSFPLDWLGVF